MEQEVNEEQAKLGSLGKWLLKRCAFREQGADCRRTDTAVTDSFCHLCNKTLII